MPQRTSGLQALAVVLLGVGPLAALFAAHYFIYLPGRKAYLQQRSYRALATVSQQLAARLDGIDASLQHPQFDVPRECDLPRPSPNLEFICWFPIDGSARPESNPRGYVKPTGEATFIYYVYEYPSPAPHALPATGVVPAQDQTQHGAAPPRACKFARDATICGRANLDAMMDPLLGGNDFDDVLLFRAGEVVYQRAATRTGNVPTLAALMEQAADQGARTTPGSGQGEANKSPPAPTVTYSKPISVEYLGDRYFLYFQRISVPPSLQAGATGATGGAPAEWLLCGLVRAKRLDWEAGALPGSLLALLLFLLLMALLAWPLLKLWFMGPRERLRATNVYLLVIACLLASGLLTSFVLYTSLQLRVSQAIDDELQRIANQVEQRFDREIKSAYRQLICFNRMYNRAQAPESTADGHTDRAMCAVPNIRAWLYPYFKQLLWVNEKGEPYLAWTPTAGDDPTQPPRAWWIMPMDPPPLELRDRPYFKDVQRGRLWELGPEALACDQGCSCPGDAHRTDPDGAGSGCSEDEASRDGPIRFAIQPVRSRIDGENTVVLAVAIWDTVDPQVALIATPLLSLIGPVVPPGFGFAVLDDTGTVLFHSDATHNLQENFFQESEDARALIAAVQARRAESVAGAYTAKAHRLYTAPLQNTPWSVVAFYDRGFIDTMHIGVAEAWLAMFGLYVAACVVGGLGLQLWRRRYRAEWLWPDPARAALYWQAAVLLLLTMATAIVVARRGDALARATLVMALPPLTLALLYLHLNRGRQLVVWQRAVALLVALVAGTIVLGCASDRYGGLAVGLTACAWGASGLSRRGSGGGGRRAFQAAYVSMLSLWLVVLGVFPAAVFFMDAYQGGTIALVKLGQLQFAQSLVQRANRLREDYRQRALASWALDERLQDRRDVYAARLFVESSSLTGGADLAADSGAANPCLSEDTKRCPLTSFLWAHLVCTPTREENDLVRALQYNISSILMRALPAHNDRASLLSQMTYDRASDGRWAWRWMGDGMRELRLTLCDDRVDASGRAERGAGRPANGHLWVQASVASIVSPSGADWWLIAMVALIAGVLVFRLLWSIADRVFLWDLPWPEPAGLPKIDPQGYEAIWAQCSEEERLILAQLAQEGFLNPNNASAIGNLAQRQLIRRAPAFRLPRGFREVVLRHAPRQQIAEWERHGERSSWSKLQTPVLMIVVLGVAFLWVTQPGLLNVTTGTIASITAALPLVLRLLGRSPEEKSDKPAAEQAEKQGAKG